VSIIVPCSWLLTYPERDLILLLMDRNRTPLSLENGASTALFQCAFSDLWLAIQNFSGAPMAIGVTCSRSVGPDSPSLVAVYGQSVCFSLSDMICLLIPLCGV